MKRRENVTRVIVDSTCDLPDRLLERFDIAVLPLSVVIDQKAYLDGVEIHLDEVYEAMRAGKVPGTSQIRWEDAAALFTSIAQAGDDFIYLAFSASMSGTFRLAKMVSREVAAEYPCCRMEIIDSQGGSMGSGLIALQLGLMNERGVPFEEMVSQCTWMTSHMKYVFTIDELKCAVRGGRLLTRTLGNVGSILNVKPLMDVRNGVLHLEKLVRGSRQSLEAMGEILSDYAGNFGKQIIGLTHADDMEKALALQRILKERLPDCGVLCQRIGGVLGSHLGIGGVGAFCLDKRPACYATL